MTAPTMTTPPEFVALGMTRSASHDYVFNDGMTVHGPVPGVTAGIKLIDKSGPLVGWAKRETAASAVRNLDALMAMRKEGGPQAAIDWLKTIPDYQRDRAADRGISVHQIAEQIIRGQHPAIPEELGAHVAAYHSFLRKWQPKFVAVEQMVMSLRWGYGGTFDAVARIGNERWGLDLKTSTNVYPETALQLAAYFHAEFIGRPGDPQKYSVPKVHRYGVIHVTPEGAELVPYMTEPGAVAEAWAAFRHTLPLHRWVNGPAKSVIGRPLNREGKVA